MKALAAQFKRLGSRLGGLDCPSDLGLTRRSVAIISLSIFLLAVGVRLLQWQNNQLTIDNVMWRLALRYQEEAHFLIKGDVASFLRGATPEPDQGILMHPPGYPLLRAVIYGVGGHSDAAIRLFQILCNAAAAVLVFLLAAQLLPRGAAICAGALVALSPQLAFCSLLLLPDSISAVPILLAVYLIVRARKRPRILNMIAAGAAIGVSCWLRANALLLAPFLGIFILVLFERRLRWRYAGALVAATILVIAPITIRNAIVFRSFIPVSLSAGQNMVGGIADYDPEKRFGFEVYDDAASRQEALLYNRPDYAEDLYRPDGVKRERARMARAWAVIRSNKLWFLGIMLRRAARMLEYERVSIVSVEPSVSHPLEITDKTELAWASAPQELTGNGVVVAEQAQVSLTENNQALRITGNDSEQGKQFISAAIAVQKKSDYVLRLPVNIEQGRMLIKIERADNGATLASATIPDSLESRALKQDFLTVAQIPFVSGSAEQIRIVVANALTTQVRPVIQLGRLELFRLGPASYLWTRYPRMLIKSAQKFFITGWMLPLALVGITLLALARNGYALAVTLSVPAYYLCIHSPLHVEYRYVLAMHYFFLMLVAVALYWIATKLWQLIKAARAATRRMSAARK